MTPLIKKAHKGNRDAMTTLYQLNKQQVCYICNLLLCDPKAADNACVQVFKNSWDYLLNGKIETEREFSDFVIKKAVNHCKNKVAKSNNKAFKIPVNKNFGATQYSADSTLQMAMPAIKFSQAYLRFTDLFSFCILMRIGRKKKLPI